MGVVDPFGHASCSRPLPSLLFISTAALYVLMHSIGTSVG